MRTKVHILLAYSLLLLALWLLINLVFSPFKPAWQTHEQKTEALQTQLDMRTSEVQHAMQSEIGFREKLIGSLTSRELGVAGSVSQGALLLQSYVKPALEMHSAVIQQMRPSNTHHSEFLHQNQLQLSFIIETDQLGSLLRNLGQLPGLHIEVVSLRKQNNYRSSEKGGVLEANLVMSMWFVKESFANDYIPEVKTASDQPSFSKVVSANTVAGLFDATYRSRLENPSLDHYRLSAITVSDDAQVALIADKLSGKTKRLMVGQMLDAWKIESINNNSVSLSYKERTEILALQIK